MPQNRLTLAACSFEVQPRDGRIQLLPYGEFRAIDGRPHDVPAWYLTEENGRDVVELANASRNQLVVDYEHQTLHKEKNGQPAPAAGWMRWLEFTPKGLFADSVVQDLQSQIAALTAERNADKGNELITAALAAGKLLPAQKAWAEGVLKQEGGLAFLTGFIENAQPVAALAGTQTAGKEPGANVVALTAEEEKAAEMLGMSHKEYAEIKKKEGEQ